MHQNKADILILSHRYEVTSGAEKSLMELVGYLISQSKVVHVVIGDKGSIAQQLETLGATYSVIHNPFWARGGEDMSDFSFAQPWNPANNSVLQLINIIKTVNPIVCVTNTIVTPWLAYAAAITKTPHAWLIHELHTDGLNLRYAIDRNQILKTIDTLSDKIFYSSHYTAKAYLPFMSQNSTVDIIYPSGAVITTPASSSPFNTSSLKLMCVGQIKDQKGQVDAIKAAKQLKKNGVEFELLFVGGTNNDDQLYFDELTQYIENAELGDTVRFLGHADNPSSLMAHADIIITCATNETFGRVTVEGMLSGAAVIGAASAGTIEIINDGTTGLLYKPGDAADLAQKITQLNNNPDLRKELAKNAKKHATKAYSDTERFKSFNDYVSSKPKRTALDLSPLEAVFSDFQTVIAQAKNNKPLHKKVLHKSKVVAKKILKRP